MKFCDGTSWNPIVEKRRDYILVVDEKTDGTDGGTFTSGVWQIRDLNTIKHDTGTNVSVATNVMTFAAVTYECNIVAPAFCVDGHTARLYNVTASAVVATGTSRWSDTSDGVDTTSRRTTRFTLVVSSELRVEHKSDTTWA